MSDTKLNDFLAAGTAAARGGFTPSPPTPASGPDPGYFWFETDTGDTYAWKQSTTSWIKIASSTATGDVTTTGSPASGDIAEFSGATSITTATATGTGNVVRAASPTLTTPALGTPSALVLTNATGLVTAGINASQVTLAKIANASANSVLVGSGATGSGSAYSEIALGTNLSMSGTTLNATSGSGKVVQAVNVLDTTEATGTTVIPFDDTIPQITEGTEFFTLAITPASSTNKLRIDVVAFASCDTADRNMAVALFQDSTANALSVGYVSEHNAFFTSVIALTYWMAAGTTSATTFRVRIGVDTSGTVTVNGSAGARKYGGVLTSSMTITEYTP